MSGKSNPGSGINPTTPTAPKPATQKNFSTKSPHKSPQPTETKQPPSENTLGTNSKRTPQRPPSQPHSNCQHAPTANLIAKCNCHPVAASLLSPPIGALRRARSHFRPGCSPSPGGTQVRDQVMECTSPKFPLPATLERADHEPATTDSDFLLSNSRRAYMMCLPPDWGHSCSIDSSF
jgi:hypothetical protein